MLNVRFWRSLDPILFASTFLLVIIGIIVLFSTGVKDAGVEAPVDAGKQVVFAFMGLGVFLLVSYIDYRIWAKMIWVFYGIALLLLLTVKFAGMTALGAQRWIDFGFFQLQPSELAKLALILVLAKFFADHYDETNRPKYFIWSIIYMLLPMALVLTQPDLGTALVFLVIWGSMVLVSKVKKTLLLGLGAAGLAIIPLVIPFLHPYQKKRIEVFLNPAADPLATGYNVMQSQIAVGSGQMTGRGLGAGSQSQLNFLPSQHTDFIFAVLSEKLGFIGALLVLGLFSVLLVRGLYIAGRSRDRFGMFLTIGILAMLLFHLFVNIGMNLGLMPVTGIPLPFLSYGGTSLLAGMIAVGLIQSVALRHKKIQFGA